MDRVNGSFRKLEGQLCYLISSDILTPAQREKITPTFAKVLEAENEWKLFIMEAKNGKL